MSSEASRQSEGSPRRRLRAWFGKPLGRLVWEAERAELDGILCNLFGYHLVQVGSLGEDGDLLFASRIPHRVVIEEDAGECLAALCGRADALPLAGDTVDVVLLPHILEFDADPHQVLREVDRVLVPEGHVVIVGFSPWSLWGLWRAVLRRRGEVPWCGQFFSQTRVRDWLALLGFQPVLTRHLFFRPPLGRRGAMDRLGFMERAGRRWWPFLSGVHILVAKKRVSTVTPIRPRWRPKRSLLGGLAEPTARGVRRER